VPVKIVTDSVADIPAAIARDLGISVVPLVLRFGSETYFDGVDLTSDEFYEKLRTSADFPATSVPSPAACAEAFEAAAAGGNEVLAITLSSKLSGTYNSALQGKALAARAGRIEVMDSGWAAIAEGFIVMEAARAGASLEEAMNAARVTASRVDFLAAFDTLDYLRRGGRIGAAAGLVGSLLRINPLINLRDGVVHPVGRTRSRAKALDALVSFAGSFAHIEELAVGNAACEPDAEALIERLGSIYPRDRILRTRLTPVMGSHTGPGLIIVAVLG
jgi:DegV family protein with EDD domain